MAGQSMSSKALGRKHQSPSQWKNFNEDYRYAVFIQTVKLQKLNEGRHLDL